MRAFPLLATAAAMTLAAAARAADIPTTTVDCSGLVESASTDTEMTTTFRDNVVAVGNNMTLHCDFLKVITTGINEKGSTIGKHDKFKYMLATGKVRIVQGDRVATCGRAEVFPGEDRIVLTENPVVKIESEHYEMAGPRMVLYRGQRRAVIEGTPGQPVHVSLPGIKDLGFPSEKPEEGTPQGKPTK
jgi:lipopolysaccharide export system protein LptA